MWFFSIWQRYDHVFIIQNILLLPFLFVAYNDYIEALYLTFFTHHKENPISMLTLITIFFQYSK